MTLSEIEKSAEAFISIEDAAEVIRCDPQRLRYKLDKEDGLPMEQRTVLFPHIQIGNRHRIGREGFLRWVRGEMNPLETLIRARKGGDAP